MAKEMIRSNLGYRKKGNIALEMVTLVIIIFIFAIVAIVGNQAFDDLNTGIQSDGSNVSRSLSQNSYDMYPSLIDNAFMILFIGFIIFIIVSAFMINTHPIFFIVSIIIMLAMGVIAIFLANSFDDFANDTGLESYANQFNYMSWVMRHTLEICIGIGFFVSIVLYIKIR